MAPREQIPQSILLLSDNVLYPEAVAFAKKNNMPENSQLNGLLEYSSQWSDLNLFVRKQGDRNWTGKKDYYKKFYADLKSTLDELRNRTKNEFNLVPTGLTRREEQDKLSEVFPLLAQEYIRHLVAEALLKNAKGK